MTEKQQELFESKSVWNAIFTMAVPAMVTMVVMILYNMADMYFVGRTGDTVQVAAVSLVGPVFSIMMAIGSMLGGGACALIAKTLGEKNTEEVHLYSSLCCWGGICFGVIFGGIVLLLREPLLTFLGSNAEMRPYASVYLTALAMGAPIMIFASAGGNILRAEGAVKQSMFSSLLSTVTNIILDPIFILVLKLGVGGGCCDSNCHWKCSGCSLSDHLLQKGKKQLARASEICNAEAVEDYEDCSNWSAKSGKQHAGRICGSICESTARTIWYDSGGGDGCGGKIDDDDQYAADGTDYGNPAADGIQLWSRRLRQTQRNYKENSDSDNWNRIGGQCYLFCWKQNSNIIVLKRAAGIGTWSEDDSFAHPFRTISGTLLHLQ